MRNFRLRKPPCQQYVSSSSLEIIHYAVIVADPGDDVAVDVHGHRYARVTLKLLHTLWMLTFHEPNRSTCMSEIVKPYLGQPGTLESRFEAAVHEVTGVRWSARRRGENVLRLLFPYSDRTLDARQAIIEVLTHGNFASIKHQTLIRVHHRRS